MPYATQQDMEDRFGADEIRRISDYADPPTGEIDPVVVAKALADASAEIDGYLIGRYALPLASPFPAPLVTACEDIARFRMHRHLAGDDIKDAYKNAIARMREIAQGLFKLDVPAALPATDGADEVLTSGPDRMFSDRSMRGY